MPHLPTNTTRSLNNPSHVYTVKSANYFADTTLRGKDLRNKCCVGYVLGYSSPNPNVQHYSRSTQLAIPSVSTGPAPKKVVNPERFHKIMMLGDIIPGSNAPFAVIMKHKDSLFRMCKNSNLAAEVTLGDLVAILRPAVDDRTLGNATHILRDPRQILILKKTLAFPEKPLQMAAQPGETIFFKRSGVSVDLYNPVFLWGNDAPCTNTTCDRQDPRCQGCLGNSAIKRNFVLRVGVDVLNQEGYDARTAMAQFEHRSWKFTQDVIVNLREMATLDYHNLSKYESVMEEKLIEMAELVNQNGGWTIMGWHRRGATTSAGPNNESILALQTRGHLIRILPTKLPEDKKEEYLATRFSCCPPVADLKQHLHEGLTNLFAQ